MADRKFIRHESVEDARSTHLAALDRACDEEKGEGWFIAAFRMGKDKKSVQMVGSTTWKWERECFKPAMEQLKEYVVDDFKDSLVDPPDLSKDGEKPSLILTPEPLPVAALPMMKKDLKGRRN